jgi:hypothetical protein
VKDAQRAQRDLGSRGSPYFHSLTENWSRAVENQWSHELLVKPLLMRFHDDEK